MTRSTDGDPGDEAKFNETLKRLLKTPPKPRKKEGAQPKPGAPRSGHKDDQERNNPKAGGKVDKDRHR